MRFAWATPDKWVWVHQAEPPAGAITDGTTNVIVEDGVAVLVTEEGEVHTTHRLRNLLQPRGYDFEGWKLGPVSAGTLIGRQAWSSHLRQRWRGRTLMRLSWMPTRACSCACERTRPTWASKTWTSTRRSPMRLSDGTARWNHRTSGKRSSSQTTTALLSDLGSLGARPADV